MNLNPSVEADKIRKTYWKEKPFPVDPAVIANLMGLKVVTVDFPRNISGALIKENGKDPVIFLHDTDSTSRKIFTCAHELGHYVSRAESNIIEEKYDYIDYRDSAASAGTDKDEIFANQFAANLLMPENEIKRLYKKKCSYVEMAQFFAVSTEAVKYRLHNLRLLSL